MTTRRVPLSNVPNAANSPFRAIQAAASKRSRAQANALEPNLYDEPPPAKRQIIELEQPIPRTPPPRKQPQATEGRVFNKRSTDSQLTAFDRKLLAAKERTAHVRVIKDEKVPNEQEVLRQWQTHYRRVFPDFVFYFESVPEDARRQYSRHLHAFGAREEKFFSKNVTHVVTTRNPPIEAGVGSSAGTNSSQSNLQLRTINPSLLDKASGFPNPLQCASGRGKFTFDAPNGKRLPPLNFQDVDTRRQPSADVLCRARDMGMKIWQLEKFGRILNVMGDSVNGESCQQSHNTRSNAVNNSKIARPADLSQLLRNELNGPGDREVALTTMDIVPFKGPYIYIRDMNEKTKPIMVREYPKVQVREQGTWPQFRSAGRGKCPFVEDAKQGRRDSDRDELKEQKERKTQAVNRTDSAPPRTCVVAPTESIKMQPPQGTGRKRPLAEMAQGGNVTRNPVQQLPALLTRGSSVEDVHAQEISQQHHPPSIRLGFHNGEPMASGMQASNITSAIRSQMISSTAAAPGAKAGTSRDIHGLQRKMLERNVAPSMTVSNASQKNFVPELVAAARSLRGVPNDRAAKLKAQENVGRGRLVHIQEEVTASEQEEAEEKTKLRGRNTMKVQKGEQRELKPGYCENCREKFDDFEEHTLGRKHRKFAVSKENWKDLDALLGELTRPMRGDEDEDTSL